MNRAEVLQEVRLMKFEDVYSRRTADKLTQEQAAYGSLRFGPLRYQLKRTIGMLPERTGQFRMYLDRAV